MSTKPLKTIADLTPDHANANRGTERGNWMLRRSLERNGAGRSVVVDRDGRVIAGNKTVEAAREAGMKIRVVQTNGDELVVVQRQDLDLQDNLGTGRELAFADNRVGEVSLDWDPATLAEAYELGHLENLDYLFSDSALDGILSRARSALDSSQANSSFQPSAEAHEHSGFRPDPVDPISRPERSAPDDFPAFDEHISTDYQCPKCGYAWSGKAKS